MVVYLANAFSLSMIPYSRSTVKIREVPVEEVKEILLSRQFVSAVGHESTAQLLSQILNISIPVNRVVITLKPSDILIVFQLLTRLPEGKILTLEELKQLKYKFYIVELVEAQ
jgi:Domain of unknown function (DUF1874).